jgi:hypothetical protein
LKHPATEVLFDNLELKIVDLLAIPQKRESKQGQRANARNVSGGLGNGGNANVIQRESSRIIKTKHQSG